MIKDKSPTYVLRSYICDGSDHHASLMNKLTPRVYINLDGETSFKYSTGKVISDKRIREHMSLYKTSLLLYQMLDKWTIEETHDYNSHFSIVYAETE